MRSGIGGRAYNLAGWFWLPVPVAAGFIALASGSLGINVTSPDMVGPLVASRVLGGAGAVVVFAVFFCSLASSIDSLLAATADLITEDIYRKMIRPGADERMLRRASAFTVVALGLFAWTVCLPRVGTLATVLFFAGPMVASTIWPLAAGLFWKKADARGASLGMVLGTLAGMIVYFEVGWYAASLCGAAVSMLAVLFSTRFSKMRFDWKTLNEEREKQNAGR